VFVDEGSTHFDARTNSREVATQFTPLAKRFAKIGVDVFATVGHTGKDLHPEVKRLVTLAFFKHSKKDVDFYEEWPADADMPTERLFGGTVEELEPALDEPNPDDAAPWEWDLDADLWSENLDWDGLLDRLFPLSSPDGSPYLFVAIIIQILLDPACGHRFRGFPQSKFLLNSRFVNNNLLQVLLGKMRHEDQEGTGRNEGNQKGKRRHRQIKPQELTGRLAGLRP